ncbi:DUF1351 domain-containing protein [Acetobacterium sp.]|uniref:DUF1351 domain-containing protein n=1 Tax=Acetobacterium sp. TaxID=1872094 RepID=UPI0027204972|nr:DUF1351 domain-containing protein [Acetobacterium sp.]MDO9492833.1 DUF1351 domain-containing protein [Acetobacterium sp.]
MEFILEKEVKDIVPAAVGFNFDQLKQELEISLTKYQNMVVTEDSTKEAKEDRAKLNALKNTIDGKRKEIKKDWNKPYVEFEDKVKVLIGMIDEPIQTIDKQVKAYEQAIKDKKAAEIKLYFDETIGDLKKLVPYDKIHVEKWLNSSERLSAIKKEISAIIETIQNDIKVIKDLEMECEQQMLDKYLVNFSLSEAMAEKKRWEDQIEKMLEYEKQQELKKQQEEAKKIVLEQVKAAAVDAETEAVIPDQVTIIAQGDHTTEAATEPPRQVIDPEPELEVLIFKVAVTPEQKKALRAFFVENKIKVGRV